MRRDFAGSLVLLCVLAVCAGDALAQAKNPASDPARTFTIATYNINFGNADLRTVAAVITKSNADLVALQETNNDSEQFLRKTLGKTYPHMAFYASKDPAGGFGLLSKSPLSDVRHGLPATGAPFGVQSARVELAGRQVLVVNVHLTPTGPARKLDAVAMMDLFRKTEATREAEARAIVAGLPARWPAFVLGDFNSMPKLGRILDHMTQNGFVDCLASAIDKGEPLPTWHWKLTEGEARFRLDYIFATRLPARTVVGHVLESEASDHFLASCSLEWAPMPVKLGEAAAEAASVAYILDTAGTTTERIKTAREMVNTSVAGLKKEQYIMIVGAGKEPLVPLAATDDNRAAALKSLPGDALAPAFLADAMHRAAKAMEPEAGPKAIFVVSDRAGQDAALRKTLESTRTDKKVQLYILDADGKPVK